MNDLVMQSVCHDVEVMNEDLVVHLIILVDDSRVVLNEVEGEEGSDYINASYILVSKTVTKALKVTPKKILFMVVMITNIVPINI